MKMWLVSILVACIMLGGGYAGYVLTDYEAEFGVFFEQTYSFTEK